MDLKQGALVLEGGGLRGVYTSGVLRFFMDKGICFPYVIGVSMGACNAANYVSRQPERNRIVCIRYVNDPRYISYSRLLMRGELFGMKFIFNTLPRSLVPFDFKTFMATKIKELSFLIEREAKLVTPVKTGRLRASIGVRNLQPLGGEVSTNTHYAIYVHEGTRYMMGRPFMKMGAESALSDFNANFKKEVDKYLESKIK